MDSRLAEFKIPNPSVNEPFPAMITMQRQCGCVRERKREEEVDDGEEVGRGRDRYIQRE